MKGWSGNNSIYISSGDSIYEEAIRSVDEDTKAVEKLKNSSK